MVESHHFQWRTKQQENLLRWKTTYRNNLDRINKIEDQIQLIDNKIKTSKSPAYSEKLDMWKLENLEQIKKIKTWNSDLSMKHSKVENKLNSFNSISLSRGIATGTSNTAASETRRAFVTNTAKDKADRDDSHRLTKLDQFKNEFFGPKLNIVLNVLNVIAKK